MGDTARVIKTKLTTQGMYGWINTECGGHHCMNRGGRRDFCNLLFQASVVVVHVYVAQS